MGKKSRQRRTGLSFADRKRRSREAELEKVQKRAEELLETVEKQEEFADVINSLRDNEMVIPIDVVGYRGFISKSGNKEWKR